MSRMDYHFKEIPVDPSFFESRLQAPRQEENETEEKLGEGRGAEVQARMKRVRKAMKSHLTLRQRKCLELYYLQGLSQPEIAELLRIHQTTVSQHIKSALEKLRHILNAKRAASPIPIISLDRGWGDK